MIDPRPVHRVLRGLGERSETLEELYNRSAPAAFRLALLLSGSRQEAEDLVQDAFVRILQRSLRARPPESFEAYLRRTIVNLARSRWRRIRVRRRFSELHGCTSREPVTLMPDVERQEDLWATLRRLPVRQRAVLFLRYYEDLTEAQTADVLGCSTNAVKCLAARGLATLRSVSRGEDVR